MKANLPISLYCGLLVGLILFANTGSAARAPAQDGQALDQQHEEPVSVELTSGRVVSGQVDSRTDQDKLWLRNDLGTGYMVRPIDWDRVQSVTLAGDRFSSQQFQSVVGDVRQSYPRPEQAAGPSNRISVGPKEQSRELVADPAYDRAVSSARSETPKVRSLAIDVRVANWDADLETDGLLVDVYPLDADGAIVPVRGSVEVTLMAPRAGMVLRPQPFVRLGHWSKQINPDDFGPDSARCRLPFQSFHPELSRDWASHGVVYARLSVPGQGVFECTEGTVRITPYSASRDYLQQTTDRRFFPMESVSRGRR